MKHPLNKAFEKVYCIVRTDEQDNKEKMQMRFNTFGIDFEFFDGAPLKFHSLLKQGLDSLNQKNVNCRFKGHIGATLSHLSIIQRAKDEGLKNVFIFEHQNMFRKDFNQQIERYLNTMPQDFDIVYLFSNFFNWNEHTQFVVDETWFTPYGSFCNNAYGINRKFFDVILDFYENNFLVIDALTSELQKTKKYKIYATYPNLCTQEPQIAGTSEDVPGGYRVNVFDYNPNFDGETLESFF